MIDNSLIFTISIPTYNRSKLLIRNIENIDRINFDKSKFEVIVVDDGSTDNTASVISSFSTNTSLNLRYIKKENGGKYTALGRAIREAKGEYFINSDSDDFLDTECLNNFCQVWNRFNKERNPEIAGVIGQNYNINQQQIQGTLYEREGMISDPITMRFKKKILGDKIPIIKTEILKEFNFPEAINNLKFIPESYILYGVSSKFDFIYTNKVFQNYNYQNDGLTSKIHKYRLDNAYGCYLVYKRYIELIPLKKTLTGYIRNYINYVRFGLHSKNRIELKSIIDFALYPIGWILYKNEK